MHKSYNYLRYHKFTLYRFCLIVTDALKSKQNQQLTYLALSDNKITSQGAKHVASLIQKCDSLTELYLANNDIDNEGAKALVKAIKERADFKNIDLDNNKFSGETITELFQILPLSKLNLTKNVLTDSQVEPLAQQIKLNKSLT